MAINKLVTRVIAKSHHRNGVSGDPFDVYIFETTEGQTMVGVDFGEMAFAVLDIAQLSHGDIAFGSNSWRGDHYAFEVRELGEGVEDNVAPDAFFIKWEKQVRQSDVSRNSAAKAARR